MRTDLHSSLISHPSPLIPNPSPLNPQSSTNVENIRQIRLFMQNKPNFPQFSPENDDLTQKQTQYKPNSKPKQTQFLLRLKMNITIYNTREYRNDATIRRKKAKPIKANNQSSLIDNHLKGKPKQTQY